MSEEGKTTTDRGSTTSSVGARRKTKNKKRPARSSLADEALPLEVRRGLDSLLAPLVKSTLHSQPEYPREHLLQLLDAAARSGGVVASSDLRRSPRSRVRSKLLKYRDAKIDPLLLPALTKVIASTRHAQRLDRSEAVPLLRDSLQPKRVRHLSKKALKKVLVDLLMGLSAEEMMDTRRIAQRASIRLGVDLSSQKRLDQVEMTVNQLLDYDSDATTEDSSDDDDDPDDVERRERTAAAVERERASLRSAYGPVPFAPNPFMLRAKLRVQVARQHLSELQSWADFECARPQRMVDWKRTKFRVQVENACQVAIGDRFRQAIDQVCWIEGLAPKTRNFLDETELLQFFAPTLDRILQFNGVAGSRSITAFSAAEFDDVEQFGEAYRSFCMDFKNQLRDRRAEDEATNLQLGNVVSTKHAASSNSPGGDVPESSTADVELSAEQLQLRQAAVEQQEAADEAAAGAAFSSQTMPNTGFSLLMVAAANNSLRCMRFLLEVGAEVDARAGPEGGTALLFAAYAGAAKAVAYLLAHGADPMRTLTNDFLVQKARTYSFVAQKLHHERERAKFKAAPLLTAQEKAEAAAAEDELRHQAEIQAAELHLEVAKREFAKQQVSVTFLETHSSLGFRLEEQDALVKDRALSQLFNARIASVEPSSALVSHGVEAGSVLTAISGHSLAGKAIAEVVQDMRTAAQQRPLTVQFLLKDDAPTAQMQQAELAEREAHSNQKLMEQAAHDAMNTVDDGFAFDDEVPDCCHPNALFLACLRGKDRVVKLLSGTSFATVDLLLPHDIVQERAAAKQRKMQAASEVGNSTSAQDDTDEDDDQHPNERAADWLTEYRTASVEDIASAVSKLKLKLVEKDAGPRLPPQLTLMHPFEWEKATELARLEAERDAKVEEAKRRARLPRKERLALEQKERFDQDTADKLSAAKLGLGLEEYRVQREKEEAQENRAWELKFGVSRDEVLNPKTTRKNNGQVATRINAGAQSNKKSASQANKGDPSAPVGDDELMTPEQRDEQKVLSAVPLKKMKNNQIQEWLARRNLSTLGDRLEILQRLQLALDQEVASRERIRNKAAVRAMEAEKAYHRLLALEARVSRLSAKADFVNQQVLVCFNATPLHTAARLGFSKCTNALVAINSSEFQRRQAIWLGFLELTMERHVIMRRKAKLDAEVARDICSDDDDLCYGDKVDPDLVDDFGDKHLESFSLRGESQLSLRFMQPLSDPAAEASLRRRKRNAEETARLRRRKRSKCDRMLEKLHRQVAAFTEKAEALILRANAPCASSFDTGQNVESYKVYQPSPQLECAPSCEPKQVLLVNLQTIDGFTPLLSAVHNKHTKCVLSLLRAKAKADIQCQGGFDIVRWNSLVRCTTARWASLQSVPGVSSTNLGAGNEAADGSRGGRPSLQLPVAEELWEYEKPKLPGEASSLVSRDTRMQAQRTKWENEWAAQEERISLREARLLAERRLLALQVGPAAAIVLGLTGSTLEEGKKNAVEARSATPSSHNHGASLSMQSTQRSRFSRRKLSSPSSSSSTTSPALSKPTPRQLRIRRRSSNRGDNSEPVDPISRLSAEAAVAQRKYSQKLQAFAAYRDAVRHRIKEQRTLLSNAENGPTGEEGYDAVEVAALAGNRDMIDVLVVEGQVKVHSPRPAAIIRYYYDFPKVLFGRWGFPGFSKSGFDAEEADSEESPAASSSAVPELALAKQGFGTEEDSDNITNVDSDSDASHTPTQSRETVQAEPRDERQTPAPPEKSVSLTEIQRQRKTLGWIFVGGTDPENPSVGAVQIPPSLPTEFVLPAEPSRLFRLRARTDVWARLGWVRPREYRVRQGSLRSTKAGRAASVVSSSTPGAQASASALRHKRLLFYTRPSFGHVVPRNQADVHWEPPGADVGTVWTVDEEFPPRPQLRVVAPVSQSEFDSDDDEALAEAQTAKAAVVTDQAKAHAEFAEAVAAWRPQWARLVFPREKIQTHFDDGKGHYWIPLIDPIPPSKNDPDSDTLGDGSDSEGDEGAKMLSSVDTIKPVKLSQEMTPDELAKYFGSDVTCAVLESRDLWEKHQDRTTSATYFFNRSLANTLLRECDEAFELVKHSDVHDSNMAVALPKRLDLADLCSWVDPRIIQFHAERCELVREGIFMATEDDDDESLRTILDRSGVETLFEKDGGAVNVVNMRQESPLIVSAAMNSTRALKEILRRGQVQALPLSAYAAKVTSPTHATVKVEITSAHATTGSEQRDSLHDQKHVDAHEARDILSLADGLREIQRLRALARHFVSTRSVVAPCRMNFRSPDVGMGALQIAIHHGHLDVVMELLRVAKYRVLMGMESLDFAALSLPAGDTILHLAVKLGGKPGMELLKMILDLKAQCAKSRRLSRLMTQLPLEQANADGATPLTLAIKAGSIQALDMLLSLGADPNSGCMRLWNPKDEAQAPPDWTARSESNPPTFNLNPIGAITRIPEEVLMADTSTGASFELDLPPLLMATSGPGHIPVLRRLLDAKAWPNCVEHASRVQDAQCFNRIVASYSHVPVADAVAHARLQVSAQYVSAPTDRRSAQTGITPLLMAVSRRNIDAVTLLIQGGAVPDLALVPGVQLPHQELAAKQDEHLGRRASVPVEGCQAGDSELCCAARLADHALCKVLVDAGAQQGSFPVVSAPVPIRIPFSLRQVKRQPNGSAPLQSKEHLVTQPIPSCATELANVVEAAAAVAEEKTRRRALDQLTGPPPPAIWSNSAEAVCTELFKVVLDVCIDDLKDLTEDLPELEPEQPEPPRYLLQSYADIQQKMKASAYTIGGVDYASIVAFFASAAKGMSGMSPKEFIRVLRKEAKLTKEVMTDNELSTVFRLVDTDGSGDVDADEFAIWLGHRKSLQQRQQELQDKIDALRARQDAKNIPEVDELFDRGEHEEHLRQNFWVLSKKCNMRDALRDPSGRAQCPPTVLVHLEDLMGFINDAGAAAVLAGESLAKHYGPEYIAFLAARSSCAGRRKPLQVLTANQNSPGESNSRFSRRLQAFEIWVGFEDLREITRAYWNLRRLAKESAVAMRAAARKRYMEQRLAKAAAERAALAAEIAADAQDGNW